MTTPFASAPRLPLPEPADRRILVALLLASATLGEGIEPALRGLAPDTLVRAVGAFAGWLSSATTVLVLVCIGYLVVRSALVARASFARSLLTGASAAGVAFSIMGMVTGRVAGTANVQIAALVLGAIGARTLTGASLARLLPPVAMASFAASATLAARAFEQGGVALWVVARGASTLAWLTLILLVVRLAATVVRAHRGAGLAAAFASTVAVAVLARDARGGGDMVASFMHRALLDGGMVVPPFGLGALPYVVPTAARIFAWAALVAVPMPALGALWVTAFLASLPAPLATLGALLAFQLEAAGADDDETRTT